VGHYKSNLRDLTFNLFELLELDKTLASNDFGDLTGVEAFDMLQRAASHAQGPLARSFIDSDRIAPRFDPANHSVELPQEFKAAVLDWQDAGWVRVGLPAEIGGIAAPATLRWAIMEFLFGAQPAAFFYLAGPSMMDVLYSEGNEQQRRWAAAGVHRNWGATMVLTEPDAGSDVGASRTSAAEQPDGTWHITGVKRFITSGDSDDLFENIAHLVLARPVGAAPGTKGLSLFLVPKYLPDPDTGEPGRRNGVYVTGLEHKMGLTASATCELSFGQHDRPAIGWLVGDIHNGIAQMFKIMEFARMAVGTKAISTLSTGYLNALEYARAQAGMLEDPEVRRALMMQKAYAEGMRALYLYTAVHHDDAAAAVISDADPQLARRIQDLLLPVIKGLGSERAYEYLGQALQICGLDGYLADYPIEQYLRDAKIDSLYEGTTAIQAQDLFFRKIIRDRATALTHLLGQMDAFVADPHGHPELAPGRRLLATATDDLRAMVTAMTGYQRQAQDEPRAVYRIGLVAVPFLLALGDLLVGWLLLWQAQTALTALNAGAVGADRAFYRGKVCAATFFAKNVLPRLSADRRVIADVELTAMTVGEAAL